MSDNKHQAALHGYCLCGAVSLLVKQPNLHFGACHCSMCRTWGGGPFLAIEHHASIDVQGAEHITHYTSSAWAERAFCKACGTHLYYHLKDKPFYGVSLGLFSADSLKEAEFDHQIFIDEKLPHYSFAEDTVKKTGAEVFAEAGA